MSGFDQSSIAVSMPTVVGADAALGGPYKIKPSEAFSGALMTVSGLTGETISVETSPDGYWGAPANPSFYRTDWQGTQLLYSTARTNLCLRSQDLSTLWALTNATLSTATTAPDGTTSLQAIVEDGTTGIHAITGPGAAVVAATSYRLSAFFKAREMTKVLFTAANTGLPSTSVAVDLVAGTATSANGSPTGIEIVNLGGGFYWVAFRVVSTGGAGSIVFYTTTDGIWANRSHAGTVGNGVYAWGAMISQEGGSYIPTTTAPVTVTDYTISNGVITLAETPVTGAALSYDNSVLPSPYYIFATGDGVRTKFAYDGVWGTLSANSGKGNGIWQVDLRGAQAYRLVKSAGSETATVNMTLKRDALQYTNSAGTWSVT